MNTQPQIISQLTALANPAKSHNSAWFFKTQPGGYGEGDHFLGLTNPQVHAAIRPYLTMDVSEIEKIIQNKYHEVRFAGLLILVSKMNKLDKSMEKQKQRGGKKEQKNTDPTAIKTAMKLIAELYLRNMKYVNNWDLVDCSAHAILGPYIWNKLTDAKLVHTLAHSPILWERRIAVLTTFYHIRKIEYDLPLAVAETLVHDPHDLIHKAVGWMLREIGKRDVDVEKAFLDKYASTMPRTMLRYAIEKFPDMERKKYREK